MNRLTASVCIACAIVGLSGAVAAAPRETTTYALVGAWFDADTIYVRYRSSWMRKAAFSLAIRGKVVASRTENFIVTLPRRAAGGTGASLRLAAGEPADDIDYRDRDFVVRRSGEILTVEVGGMRVAPDGCAPSDWLDDGIARSADGLFVCGAFVDASGRVAWQVPTATVRLLQQRLAAANQRTPGAAGVTAPIFAAAWSGGRLLIAADWTTAHPAAVLLATVDPAHPQSPTFATSGMGASTGVFGLRTARPSYAPAGGFVVGAGWGQPPRYAFCEPGRCTPLPVDGACDVLVDALQHVAWCVRVGNSSLPEARITPIGW